MRIDGSVKTGARQALVNDFQNNRDLRAAVLSIQAAGTGLTLTVSLCIAPQMPCYACMWHGGEGFSHAHGEPVHGIADA